MCYSVCIFQKNSGRHAHGPLWRNDRLRRPFHVNQGTDPPSLDSGWLTPLSKNPGAAPVQIDHDFTKNRPIVFHDCECIFARILSLLFIVNLY